MMTIAEYVAAKIAEAPPISERQRDRLTLLFAPYRKSARELAAKRRAA